MKIKAITKITFLLINISIFAIGGGGSGTPDDVKIEDPSGIEEENVVSVIKEVKTPKITIDGKDTSLDLKSQKK